MTMRSNNCSFDNKCCKKNVNYSLQPICHCDVYASLPLQNTIKMRHTSTKAARRLTTALHHRSSMFQPQTMVYCVVPVTPSTDPQRSSVLINNIETRTTINDIIAPDEYQAFLRDPQWVCLGFLLE